LHAVLDFPGETEFLGQLHGHGLNPLEHDGQADHAGHQDRGEGGLGARDPAGRADALSDFREYVEEDEAEQEGLHQGAHHELDDVLPHDDEVAQNQRTQRHPTGRGGRAGRRQ
jgi:hypothetical protein